jgi:C4-dicarboxylate transporter DctM subunit
MVSLVLFGLLALFLILNAPVGIAIGIASIGTMIYGGTASLMSIPQALVSSVDSFPLLAIPLFIFAGDLMCVGGLSSRILNVCNVFFGRVTGGLAIVTVVFCMFFAAVSGSATATVAAVGTMVIPTMLRLGYSKPFVLALITTAGSLGVIIPPSIPMVIFGVATGASVTSMFMGGFFPGLLIGFSLIAYSYYHCKKAGIQGTAEKISKEEALKAIWDSKWAMINPVIILGGIYLGVFTPTEAAAVAVGYALLCGWLLHKELTFKTLVSALKTSCSTTGTAMIIIGFATSFSKVLTLEHIPELVAQGLLEFSSNKIVLIMLIIGLLLIVGCFMDATPAILILGPILLPVTQAIGLDPVHYGLIFIVAVAIGYTTPPLGTNLFVCSRIANEPVEVILKGMMPFFAVMIGCLLAIAFIPDIVMFLPNMLAK